MHACATCSQRMPWDMGLCTPLLHELGKGRWTIHCQHHGLAGAAGAHKHAHRLEHLPCQGAWSPGCKFMRVPSVPASHSVTQRAGTRTHAQVGVQDAGQVDIHLHEQPSATIRAPAACVNTAGSAQHADMVIVPPSQSARQQGVGLRVLLLQPRCKALDPHRCLCFATRSAAMAHASDAAISLASIRVHCSMPSTTSCAVVVSHPMV